MNLHVYLLVLSVGTAVLALWADDRWPALRPKGMRGVLLRLVAVTALSYMPVLVTGSARLGVAALQLLLVWLVAVWAIRYLQGLLGQYRS